MPANNDKSGDACYELDCSERHAKSAAVKFAAGRGASYVWCGPLSRNEIEGLNRAIADGLSVRMILGGGSKIVLSDVRADAHDAESVLIEGRMTTAPFQPI